jgi:hypothetical protein
MNRSAQTLTVAAALAVAILIATVKPPALNAQNNNPNGPNVTIASPLPLPVTGSVSVTSLPSLHIGQLPGPQLPSVYQKTLTRAGWGIGNSILFDNSEFQIPSGKVLVLEHVSAIAHTAGENAFVSASLTCNASAQSAEHVLTLTDVGVFSGARRRVGSAPMRCYAASLSAAFLHTAGTIPIVVGSPAVTLSLSGYLVDVPSVP